MATAGINITATLDDKASAALDKLSNKLSGMNKLVSGMNTGMLIMAFQQIAQFGKKAVDAFVESDIAVSKLNNALKLTGTYSEQMSKYMADAANELAEMSTYTDEEILVVFQRLNLYTGMAGENLKNMGKLTLDMAATFDKSPEQMAQLVARTLQGQDALKKYGITLNDNLRGHERIVALQEKMNQISGEAGGASKWAVEMNKTAQRWDNLLETLGEKLAPLKVVVDWAISGVELIYLGLDSFFSALFTGIAKFIKIITDSVKNTTIFFLTAVDTLLNPIIAVINTVIDLYNFVTGSSINKISENITEGVRNDIEKWYKNNVGSYFDAVIKKGTDRLVANGKRILDIFSGRETKSTPIGSVQGTAVVDEIEQDKKSEKKETKDLLDKWMKDLKEQEELMTQVKMWWQDVFSRVAPRTSELFARRAQERKDKEAIEDTFGKGTYEKLQNLDALFGGMLDGWAEVTSSIVTDMRNALVNGLFGGEANSIVEKFASGILNSLLNRFAQKLNDIFADVIMKLAEKAAVELGINVLFAAIGLHQGGSVPKAHNGTFIDSQPSVERLILVRGGETVRTEDQELQLQNRMQQRTSPAQTQQIVYNYNISAIDVKSFERLITQPEYRASLNKAMTLQSVRRK